MFNKAIIKNRKAKFQLVSKISFQWKLSTYI